MPKRRWTSRKPGDSINLETDLLARYVDQLLQERSSGDEPAEAGTAVGGGGSS